mmetsp:Transcript_2032/g.3079  ORF Transcript_2032/g.3079 Transcript_2032/m.3079 type:complete len:207 (-) Transcript_2032:150-770(-)
MQSRRFGCILALSHLLYAATVPRTAGSVKGRIASSAALRHASFKPYHTKALTSNPFNRRFTLTQREHPESLLGSPIVPKADTSMEKLPDMLEIAPCNVELPKDYPRDWDEEKEDEASFILRHYAVEKPEAPKAWASETWKADMQAEFFSRWVPFRAWLRTHPKGQRLYNGVMIFKDLVYVYFRYYVPLFLVLNALRIVFTRIFLGV